MYPQDHILLSMIGDAWTGAETWTYGLRVRAPDANPDPAGWDLTGFAAAVAPLAQALHVSMGMSHPAHVRLTSIKAAPIIGATGHYPPDIESEEYIFPAPISGVPAPAFVNGASYVIPQATVAVTLMSDSPRGYAGKGRIYPPPTVKPLQATGLIDVNYTTDAANAVKTFINAVNGLPQAGLVCIFSKGKGTKHVDAAGKVTWTYETGGASRPVVAVRVGRVVDTQRRRRRALTEAPVSVNL